MQNLNLKRCLILSFLLSLPTLGFSIDWLQWRGPNRNGTTPESDWNPAAIQDKTNILWIKDIGMGHSSVVVNGDRIYTMGNREIGDEQYEDIIWCLDAETGQEIWTRTYHCSEGEDPGPGATPAFNENRLYTLSREGHLLCLDANDGTIIWKRHLVEEALASVRDRWFAGSPLLHNNYLIINANESGIIFNKMTGETAWNSSSGEPGFESPVLCTIDGKDRILSRNDRHLSAIDLETGEEIWKFHQGWGDADAIILGENILITGQHTALLDVSGNTPKVVWKNPDIQWQFQSAAVHGNYAYGFGLIDWEKDTQDFYCFDIRDGELKWTKTFEIYGSSIIADGWLVILTGRGRLVIAEASPESYREIAQKQIIKMQKNDNSKGYRRECHCWTNPVLANGRIYARNSFGTLVCVDVGH